MSARQVVLSSSWGEGANSKSRRELSRFDSARPLPPFLLVKFSYEPVAIFAKICLSPGFIEICLSPFEPVAIFAKICLSPGFFEICLSSFEPVAIFVEICQRGEEMLAHRSSLFQSLKKEVSEKLPLPTLKFVQSKFFLNLSKSFEPVAIFVEIYLSPSFLEICLSPFEISLSPFEPVAIFVEICLSPGFIEICLSPSFFEICLSPFEPVAIFITLRI